MHKNNVKKILVDLRNNRTKFNRPAFTYDDQNTLDIDFSIYHTINDYLYDGDRQLERAMTLISEQNERSE